MGCNSKCSYCIVPSVRGREQSRRPGEILAEVQRLADAGVREVTLLGQNVNSWGRDLAPDVRTEFGELLRACDAVDGIERIRFTSPHPKDFREPVIAAMAECASVCEHVHLPLQSGLVARPEGDAAHVLARALSRARRTSSAPRSPTSRSAPTSSSASRARPRTTSAQTLEVVEEVGYDSAFTFVYSPRAGTEAAALPDQVPHEVKIERMERLVELTQRIARERNEARDRPDRAGARRRPVADRSDRSRAAGPGATRPSTSPVTRQAGQLADVRIESATSTTLRGTAHALVARLNVSITSVRQD